MMQYWNPRCVPPWNEAELFQKVENAASYGSAEYGALTYEATFGHLQMTPPPSVFAQSNSIGWGNATFPTEITPRPWLIEGALMEGAVTLLLAAGSSGKSSISLSVAVHGAQGKDFAGFKTRKKFKTIVYNGEDDLPEQSRRLLACCLAHNYEYSKVKQDIMLLSSEQMMFDIVKKDFSKAVRNDALIQQIIEVCSAPDVGLLVIDPLVDIHECDESDNVQMAHVMRTLTYIAKTARVAVLVLHHIAKGSANDDRVGNQDIGRGASAIVNASRVAFTLLGPSQKDAEEFGMQEAERRMWVRMDDAKTSFTLQGSQATWFKKEGYASRPVMQSAHSSTARSSRDGRR